MEASPSKPHFHVTAGLLWQRGRLLITKRPAGSHLAGYWEFPGGKQEQSETLEACLEREIKEELGLEVRVERLLCTVDHEYENRIVSLYLFLCAPLSTKVETLGCEEAKWVYPKDLGKYRFPPPDEEIIELLRRDSRRQGFNEAL